MPCNRMRQVFLWAQFRQGKMVLGLYSESFFQKREAMRSEFLVLNSQLQVFPYPSIYIINNRHDTPQIHYWLGKFRLNPKKYSDMYPCICGHLWFWKKMILHDTPSLPSMVSRMIKNLKMYTKVLISQMYLFSLLVIIEDL